MANKCNWTMREAKRWVEDHKGKNLDAILAEYEEHKGIDESEGVIAEFLGLEEVSEETRPEKRETSQEEIADNLDYVIKLIESEGMNDEVEEDAWNLVREVMRLSGNDIPVDILEKVGAVLNQKNRTRLNDIKQLAQEVLDSAGQEEPEDDKVIEPTITKEEILKIVRVAVTDAIEKAQGKVS